MKRFLLTMALPAVVALSASALEYTLLSGNLSDNILDLASTRDTKLTLKGTASADDLELLKEMSRSIKTLDMSSLTLPSDAVPTAMLIGSSVTSVSLPSTVKSIGSSAFAGSALRSIAVPSSVTSIGDGAFANCPDLVSVSIPSSSVTLGKNMFKGCTSLATATLGSGLTEIPESTFDGCSSLTSSLPQGVTSVGAYAYRGTALSELDLTNVTSIGDFAFAHMTDLEDITVDLSQMSSIGKGTFLSDSGIAELPQTYDNLPALLFSYTAGGDSVRIDAPTVDVAAFANNENTEIVSLGKSVSKISAHAFRNMAGLRKVHVAEHTSAIEDVDKEAFSGLEQEDGTYDIYLNIGQQDPESWEEHKVWKLFKIVNESSAVGSVVKDNPLAVTVTRNGDTVEVTSNDSIDFIGIYSTAGIVLREEKPGTTQASLSGLGDYDVLVVKVISAGRAKMVKIK